MKFSALLLALLCSPAFAQELRFNRDIRPILSDKCFHCHGPDSHKREADLRLDERAVALEAQAIVPGKPQESELMARVLSHDPKAHMPPRKSKLGDLSAQEIDTLRRWIAQGAPYEAHWSFLPLPTAAPASIDSLVSAGLASRGLALQPEADRATLLRRVCFDLSGLPPTPKEVDEFLADASPEAYPRLVDRLLASPRFGERMAVDWLDLARYSDSFGFQVDRARDVWPWRDWVISAFNSNLPFDKFITWQIAGDLLPNPTDDQILATAFNRLHQQEAEGGSVEEEYRVEYVCDRVQTFATAFLGLTFECARCHDHKFDPIAQKDYYQLFAMFQNIDEAGLYSFFTESAPTPTLDLAGADTKKKLAALKETIAATEGAIAALNAKTGEPAFEAWLAQRPAALVPSGELAHFSFDELTPKKQFTNALDPAKPATLKGENHLIPSPRGNAVEFTGDDPVDLPLGNFAASDPFTLALWIQTPDLKKRAVVLHRSRAWTDAASRGYEILLEEGRLKWSLIHFWPGNAVSIRAKTPLAPGTWAHLSVSSDGSGRAEGLRIFLDGQPVETETVHDSLTRDITGGGGDNIALGERFRDRGFKGGAIDELRVFNRTLTPVEIRSLLEPPGALLSKAASALSPEEKSELHALFIATAVPAFGEAQAALKTARAEWFKLSGAQREMMVMRELPEPRKAFTLFRGQYDQPREEVHPGVPHAFAPLPAGAPNNRLGLARWLTDPAHPLTARVSVNRFWQNIFGRGLVKTAEDFGSQGTRPLYPEVIDALAERFIQSGWDTKALLKAIVLSRTYRQRSLADEKTMADDPENEWLARGPRFRLSAEMIRDNALAAAGLLSEKIGGAPVIPYEMSEAFKPLKPSGLYRRSLYTTWRRTGPPPAMLAFDAPRRAVCAARRERTDSPLQALILLNGTQFIEAARVLGETVHKETGGDVERMIEQVFLRCLSRRPDERERAITRQLYSEQLAWFTLHPEAATELLKIGETKPNLELPAPAAAAATVLAQALLNHDACVVKQ